MSQLTDFIRQYGEAQAAEFCRREPIMTVFNLFWEDDKQIIPACERMGWQTLDDLMRGSIASMPPSAIPARSPT